MNQPLKEVKLGGGVWKIKAHPLNKDILIMCLYAKWFCYC